MKTPHAARATWRLVSLLGLLGLALTLAFVSGCASQAPTSGAVRDGAQSGTMAPYPDVTFMVFTDTHYYDPALGTSGAAWKAYMAADRKLLENSKEALEVAFERVKIVKPAFVLISGDLTKDGEAQDHVQVAALLRDLKAAGIPSFVIPGNHDVNNPDAERYLPSGGVEGVPTMSPAEFAGNYEEFGYGQAISRDPASLSYVVEPVPGLWILALDSVKYEDNAKVGHSVTSGRIRKESLAWVAERLAEAEKSGKTVVAMEHHPLLEHYDGMKAKYGAYVVDDNWSVASFLASRGVRLIFTGHFHASSIVEHRWDSSAPAALRGRTIVDVETGSLVTWPCTYRTVTLSGDGMTRIATSRVAQLPSFASAGRSFDADGRVVIEDGIRNVAFATMKRLGVPESDRLALSGQIVNAMMAHYAGNASFTGTEMIKKDGLSLMGGLVVASYDTFIQGLWRARSPAGVELMEDSKILIAPDGTWTAALN